MSARFQLPAVGTRHYLSTVKHQSTVTWKQGADVTAASDLLVGIPGNAFDVTGSTQIDTIATKGIGTYITLQFDGAPLLAHDATNFDLGGANIQANAGDVAFLYEYASADWRLISYTYAADQRRVDSTGAVTNAVQPCFRVTNTLVSNVTGNGADYTVVFATEVFDQNADFDGTSTFTAPITGRYLLTTVVNAQGGTGAGDDITLTITTSNDIYWNATVNANTIGTLDGRQISIVADMNSADTATVTFKIGGEASDLYDIAVGRAMFSGVLVA